MTHSELLALTGDQIKYFEYSLHWPDILKQQIPFGFPLFLHVVGLVGISVLPYLTLILWGIGLAFLWKCLKRTGFGPMMSFGIIAPLSVSILMRPWAWHGNPYFYANTERLTAILSVVLFGLCLVGESYWTIGILTFVICLVRPAMLFLPIVVLWQVPRRKMLIALAMPFALFLGLRWAVAGEPTFCSYGAVQATRIYAMMVEPEDILKVPPKFVGLETEILMQRYNLEHRHKIKDIEFDRMAERDLYNRWYYGDQFQSVVKDYDNAFLRELWGYEFRLHWQERVSIYFRALRVALTKIQDPVLVFGLVGLFWFVVMWGMNILPEYTEHLVLMFRWFSTWTFFSITTLLLVQFPDDRYMQVCYMWLPSMLGCAIGMIW